MTSVPIEVLTAGAVDVIPDRGLRDKLALGRSLRVKLGIDPSRPDLTLGHTVVLRKLRQFQDAGHTAVLIVGDFTGRVGDPSGRSDTRPMLTEEEADANAHTYLEQAGLVLDLDRAEVRRNSEWLGSLGSDGLIRLAATATVAQMLEREDFRTRHQQGHPLSVVELLYPLLQGYDSVAIEADVELGGTDQTFNLLMGREVQRAYGQEPQVVLTTPLIEGLDGVRKMSKSLDNYVGLTEPPDDQFGKLMSIPDGLIAKYELLCTDLGPEDHVRVLAGLADGSIHPNVEKRRMARAIVDLYHGPGAGVRAEARFDQVFKRHELPPDISEVTLPSDVVREGTIWLARALVTAGLASSNAEARRSIAQGAVRIDSEQVTDPDVELSPEQLIGKVVQVGKRRFARIAGVV
jgi:tyrosyl-tRNA synthetase